MKIHEDFINAISYPILDFLANHTDAKDWPKKLKTSTQMIIEQSIREGIIDIANQVDDIEALVIATLQNPAFHKVTGPLSAKNRALDAVTIAKYCREGITNHVRETRNDTENNPLLD